MKNEITESLKDMLASDDEAMMQLGFTLCRELKIPLNVIKTHLNWRFEIQRRNKTLYLIKKRIKQYPYTIKTGRGGLELLNQALKNEIKNK